MFRSKGLQYKDKLDILFSKPEAIWSTPQDDSSNALPTQMETSEKDDTSFSSDDQEDENHVPVNVDCQVAVSRAQKRTCSENFTGRRKKRLARELSTSLKHIANAIENVVPKSMRIDPPGCSIHDIMQLVEETPGIIRGDDLYMFAARLFLKRQCREMFEVLKEPNIRLEWLKSMKASSNALSFLHVFSP
ncbi:hypothetical protein Scep_015816 [Stephania cephalantha]|uniref:Uncharacterized protein n=1 Tax=Stephania cephalantha TaxID=152367 RepID=A0AAP0P361_9MAGN